MPELNYQLKETLLHVQNLGVSYGGRPILEGITLTEKDCVRPGINQGQTIAVLGRSGRGKSTFFRTLTGLEKPTTGQVLIPDLSKPSTDGLQPARPVREGDVGFVDQAYTLFRHKTVFQAMEFALRNATLSAKERQEHIRHELAEWGLEKQKDQYPNQLSGGQRQRTAILEQILSSSYYLVLDEPFSGLDVGNIQNVRQAFERISHRNDLNTIIFSTHDLDLAVEMADSIYVIGYPTTSSGLKPVGTLLKHYDLKALGLAWHDGITREHIELAAEIRSLVLAS